MTRCVNFYQYWKEHPNFCEKSPDTVRLIDNYVSFLDAVISIGGNEEKTIEAVTEGAIRPLFKVKNKNTYDKVVEIVSDHVSKGEIISGHDIQVWIDLVERKPTPGRCSIDIVETPSELWAGTDHEGDINVPIPTIVGKETLICDDCKPRPLKDSYLKQLSFQALVCPTCIEVRNHKCTVNTDCPVCGAKLVPVIVKVERVIGVLE